MTELPVKSTSFSVKQFVQRGQLGCPWTGGGSEAVPTTHLFAIALDQLTVSPLLYTDTYEKGNEGAFPLLAWSDKSKTLPLGTYGRTKGKGRCVSLRANQSVIESKITIRASQPKRCVVHNFSVSLKYWHGKTT